MYITLRLDSDIERGLLSQELAKDLILKRILHLNINCGLTYHLSPRLGYRARVIMLRVSFWIHILTGNIN
jgi:hypothetical protein